MRIGATEKSTFLNSGATETFNQLKQAFTKALILWYFDPEYHIRIEINTSSYVIGEILSQLIFDQLTSDYLTFDQG